MKMDHPCRGCVDAVMDPSGVGGYLCDYMTHNGHSRMWWLNQPAGEEEA